MQYNVSVHMQTQNKLVRNVMIGGFGSSAASHTITKTHIISWPRSRAYTYIAQTRVLISHRSTVRCSAERQTDLMMVLWS